MIHLIFRNSILQKASQVQGSIRKAKTVKP
jgi:hypothetical protein